MNHHGRMMLHVHYSVMYICLNGASRALFNHVYFLMLKVYYVR